MTVTDPTHPMTQEARDAAHAAEASAPPPVVSPATQLQAALDQLNHPGNLDLHDRLHNIQNAIRIIATHLMPLLPTA